MYKTKNGNAELPKIDSKTEIGNKNGNKVGIYKITSPSGKVYIGQSVNLIRRKHRYSLLQCKKQIRLYNSIKKYGWKDHIFEILEECKISELNKRERYWQDFYDVLGPNGLNCVLTNTESKSGKMSKETVKRLSESLKGRTLSDETKEKISNTKSGIKMSKEFKEKRRKGSLGKNNNFYNKTHTTETKKKMSKNRKGLLKRGNNGRAVKLIDKNTKQIFDCIKDAAEDLNIKVQTLRAMLKGHQKNKTNLIYLKDFVVDDNKISDIM